MSESGEGAAPHLASAADIERWGADVVGARTVFPRLVRRVIEQTNDQVVELDMRADKGAGYKGYDGRVRAAKATPLVPAGLSVWELGVGGSPGTKANQDYNKRTEDPLDVDPTTTTFVFVTGQRWPGRTTWQEEKRAEGKWMDVRAFDADGLEAAFESAPAAHYWISELLGKPVSGVQTIEDWWGRFLRLSNPQLTPSLVLAGRADQAASLLRIFDDESRITTVSASSTDDVLAFVASTLLSADAGGTDLLARTLIVHDGFTLRLLDRSSKLLILLPYEDNLRREAQLVQSHHVVFLAPEGVPSDIELAKVDGELFKQELISLGVAEDQAPKLAAAARRGLISYQHAAPLHGALPRAWTAAFSSAVVRRAWLVGSWHEGKSGDLDVLSTLFGTTYDGARDELTPLSEGEDPIFVIVGETWTLSSAVEAWRFGNARINGTDLNALEVVIQTVLGAVDPALELDVAERWKAGIYGKTRIHSADLRRGLATTLAICGTHGEGRQIGARSVSDWAASMVAQLLHRANEDTTGHLWASLSDLLPLLAEAAPDIFLRAVQKGVAGTDPVLQTMFIDQTDALSVNSPHTGLLWALETLAWSESHAALTVTVLARLAEIDPGGRLSNRPFASLVGIFRPWWPQTCLSADRRLAVLDAVRKNHPDIGFELMLGLLPSPHAIGSASHTPTFRNWSVEEK